MAPETLAIGVISFDRAALSRACIDSLDAHTTRPFHLVVADNGSRDPAAARLLDDLEKRSRTTVLRLGANRGPSAERVAPRHFSRRADAEAPEKTVLNHTPGPGFFIW